MPFGKKGEFGLIRKIQDIVPNHQNNLLQGIGDDTAVFKFPNHESGLVTTDTLVEGTHFDLAYTPFDALGWKSLAVNLSDIAAMGGKPLNAVIGLTLNEKWTEENVLKFYEGFRKCSDIYHCPLAGGDTTWSSGNSVITVTILGSGSSPDIIYRHGANPGDLIYVSRALGGAKLGLSLLESHQGNGKYSSSLDHFLWPKPELPFVHSIMQAVKITSMIDISDGLSSELHHLCEASKTGCLIQADAIPVHEEVQTWCEKNGEDVVQYALNSGEEYALLFTINPGQKNKLESLPKNILHSLKEIGRMTSQKEGMTINRNGEIHAFTAQGWDHFIHTR